MFESSVDQEPSRPARCLPCADHQVVERSMIPSNRASYRKCMIFALQNGIFAFLSHEVGTRRYVYSVFCIL